MSGAHDAECDVLSSGDARRANASEGGAEDARAIAIDRDER
jgi:hypothetical protein